MFLSLRCPVIWWMTEGARGKEQSHVTFISSRRPEFFFLHIISDLYLYRHCIIRWPLH